MRMKSLASPEVLLETKERLRSLTPEDRALWGKMSVTQMVRHLSCAYDVALADRNVEPMKGPPPWLLKFAALRSGLRWPKGRPTTPELVLALEEESTATFAALVGETEGKMEAVASGVRWQGSHPMFGRMSAEDWMRWGYLHADHHLRQFGR
jgi:Protein of unknown function (DUF1569)